MLVGGDLAEPLVGAGLEVRYKGGGQTSPPVTAREDQRRQRGQGGQGDSHGRFWRKWHLRNRGSTRTALFITAEIIRTSVDCHLASPGPPGPWLPGAPSRHDHC